MSKNYLLRMYAELVSVTIKPVSTTLQSLYIKKIESRSLETLINSGKLRFKKVDIH